MCPGCSRWQSQWGRRCRRGLLFLVEGQVRARQQNGSRAGFGQGANAVCRRVLEVVGGQRTEARREFCASTVAQLVGMKFDSQVEFARAREQPLDLPGIERDGLAVSVDGIGETLAGGGGPSSDG